jgi:hypothetical protein
MPSEAHGPDQDDPVAHRRQLGAQGAGAATGAAIGMAGGPLGVVGGAIAGVVVERALLALGEHLSQREQLRTRRTLEIITADAENRVRHGESRREDDFFTSNGNLRPPAEDLLEGILRQAAASYDERMVPFFARIFGNVAFDPGISPDDVHYVIRAAASLTYRQFVALAVFANSALSAKGLHSAWVERNEGRALPDRAVLAEIDDLAARRLIGVDVDGFVYGVGEAAGTLGSASRTDYERLRLMPSGELLVRLTGSDGIEEVERTQWLDDLYGHPI